MGYAMSTDSALVKAYLTSAKKWSSCISTRRKAIAEICNEHMTRTWSRMNEEERAQVDRHLPEVL